MVKVKITKEGVKGADDGAIVRPYAKGVIYDVSEALGAVFIEADEAVEVDEEKPSVTAKVNARKEKAAAEKVEAEKATAEKVEADRLAAEKAAAEKAAAEGGAPSIGLPPIPGKK